MVMARSASGPHPVPCLRLPALPHRHAAEPDTADHLAHSPDSRAAHRSGRPSQRQEPFEGSRVRPRDVDDLRPACCPGHQRYRVRADAECRCYRGQGGRRGLAIHGARADTDHQRAIVLAANARASRSWPDSNRDPHHLSVSAGASQCTGNARSAAGRWVRDHGQPGPATGG